MSVKRRSVEGLENHRQVFHPFHRPWDRAAIPTDVTSRGKWKPSRRLPTFPRRGYSHLSIKKTKKGCHEKKLELPSWLIRRTTQTRALRLTATVATSVTFPGDAIRPGKVVDAGQSPPVRPGNYIGEKTGGSDRCTMIGHIARTAMLVLVARHSASS
jgi:hypothetical protein